jgi:hypothetical protein
MDIVMVIKDSEAQQQHQGCY